MTSDGGFVIYGSVDLVKFSHGHAWRTNSRVMSSGFILAIDDISLDRYCRFPMADIILNENDIRISKPVLE